MNQGECCIEPVIETIPKMFEIQTVVDMWMEGKIKILDNVLQRPEADDWKPIKKIQKTKDKKTKKEKRTEQIIHSKKAISYMEQVLNGQVDSSTMTLVVADTFKSELEGKILEVKKEIELAKSNKIDKRVIQSLEASLNYYDTILNDILNCHDLSKVVYFCIDGQNRIINALTPFITGKRYPKDDKSNFLKLFETGDSLMFRNADDTCVVRDNFILNDLTHGQQGAILKKEIQVTIAETGTIENHVTSLIGINEGTPWPSFVKILTKKWMTPVGYVLLQYVNKESSTYPLIKQFFSLVTGKYDFSNKYIRSKHGDCYAILELAYYHYKQSWPTSESKLEDFLKDEPYENSKKVASVEFVMEFFKWLTITMNPVETEKNKGKPFSKSFTKEHHVNCLFMLFSLITIKDLRLVNINFYNDKQTFNVLKDIDQPSEFILDFTEYLEDLKDPEEHPDDFEDPDDVTSYKNNTFKWSSNGNFTPAHINCKEKFLVKYVKDSWEKLENEKVVNKFAKRKNRIGPVGRGGILRNQNGKDPYARDIEGASSMIDKFDPNTENGHIKAIKGKGRGSDKKENKQVEYIDDNRTTLSSV